MDTAAKTHLIPVYECRLVRTGSQREATKHLADRPEAAYGILKRYLEGADREHFVVMVMDAKLRVLGINTVSVGTLTASLVHPREIFKAAILLNAHSILMCHNHPSGDPTPSREDMEITKRMIEAGRLLGIEVIESMVIGEDRYYSLRERQKHLWD